MNYILHSISYEFDIYRTCFLINRFVLRIEYQNMTKVTCVTYLTVDGTDFQNQTLKSGMGVIPINLKIWFVV